MEAKTPAALSNQAKKKSSIMKQKSIVKDGVVQNVTVEIEVDENELKILEEAKKRDE